MAVTELIRNTNSETKVDFWQLPTLSGDEGLFMPVGIEHFSWDLLNKNVRLLRLITADVNEADITDKRFRRLFHNDREMLKYVDRLLVQSWLNGIESQVMSLSLTLEGEISGLNKLGGSWANMVDLITLEASLRQLFDQKDSQVVLLTPSHATLYPEVRAAIEGRQGFEGLGIMVFDEHVDIYQTSSDTYNQWVRKSNVLDHLLAEGLVNYVSVVGISPWTEDIMKGSVPDFSWDALLGIGKQRTRTESVYKDNHKRLGLISCPTVGDLHGNRSGKTEYEPRVRAEVRKMKKRGVTRLVFSCDVDVLDASEGYLAFEYNPFAVALSLGMKNLERFWGEPLVMARSNELTSKDRCLRADYVAQLLMEALFGDTDIIDQSAREMTAKSIIKAKYPGGLKLAELIQIIRCARDEARKIGLQIGMELPSEGRWLGDITELSGDTDIVDENGSGRMAVAVKQIAEAMVGNV